MPFRSIETLTSLDLHHSHRAPQFNWQLGHILVVENAITDEQLELALEYQKEHAGRLGAVLIDLGYTTEAIIHKALIKKFGIPKVSLKSFPLSEDAFNLISLDMVIKHTIVPLTINDNRLFLAMADPMNWQVISEISEYTGLSVESVLASSGEIHSLIAIHRRCGEVMRMKERMTESRIESALLEKKAKLPDRWMTKYNILPLAVIEPYLFLAMENTQDKNVIELVYEKTGLWVAPVPASPVEIDQIERIRQQIDAQQIAEQTASINLSASQSLPASKPKPKIGCGSTINGRFTLKSVLGTGGMGTVYKAIDLRRQEALDENCYVALKILRESVKYHPAAYMSMQQEASKTQQLRHPNIVTVNDFDRDGETIYITMEYLEGRSLGELQKYEYPNGMPLAIYCDILSKITSALSFAHENHIIHCDFKPGNVFVTREGDVKVIDFGIAKSSEADTSKTRLNDQPIAACTPSYATKELFNGLEPLPSDDVYALACVTYTMLTGKHPYHQHSAIEAERLSLKPERIKFLANNQWKGLLRGLSYSRQDRTPTVDEFSKSMKPRKWLRYLIYFVMFVLTGSFTHTLYLYITLYTS